MASEPCNTPSTTLCRSLSNWEVVEAYLRHAKGEPTQLFASTYGVSYRTLNRAFRKMEAMVA